MARRRSLGDETDLFLRRLDTGRDLIFGCKGFVLGWIDLVLSEDWKGGFDVEFFDADFAGRHDAGAAEKGEMAVEKPREKTIKS